MDVLKQQNNFEGRKKESILNLNLVLTKNNQLPYTYNNTYQKSEIAH